MNDYFMARAKRFHRCETHLLKICQQLIDKGYVIRMYKSDTDGNSIIKGVSIEKDGRAVGFGIAEVLYRFYIGSGVMDSLHSIDIYETDDPQFTVDDVIEGFNKLAGPITKRDRFEWMWVTMPKDYKHPFSGFFKEAKLIPSEYHQSC